MVKVECLTVRLACVKHAASVRPEPGSNSPYLIYEEPLGSFLLCFCLRFTEGLLLFRILADTFIRLFNSFHCSVFKEHLRPI